MNMGVSYDEYWNGDYTKLPYYRKAYEIKRKETNQQLWLLGVYFKHAIISSFLEDGKYPDAPLPLTLEDVRAMEEKQKETEITNARTYMEAAMHKINKQRKEGGKNNG